MTCSLNWIKILTVCALGASASHGQLLLNHDFSEGVRNNQNLPTASGWYRGGGSNALLTATPGNLAFDQTASGSHLLQTNFVDDTAGYTLSIGESLVMRYTFSPFNMLTDNAFNSDNRIGLFSYANNPGISLSADWSTTVQRTAQE